MDNLSRRSFLKKGSTAVGAAGVAAVAPGLRGVVWGNAADRRIQHEHPHEAEHEHQLAGEAAHEEPLVAHVRNLNTGEIDLFVGQRRVTVRDRATASRLDRATRS